MPIYEYACQDCGAQFEKFVRSMTAQNEIRCPDCGGIHTKKGWSLFGTGAGAGNGLASMATSAANACGPAST